MNSMILQIKPISDIFSRKKKKLYIVSSEDESNAASIEYQDNDFVSSVRDSSEEEMPFVGKTNKGPSEEKGKGKQKMLAELESPKPSFPPAHKQGNPKNAMQDTNRETVPNKESEGSKQNKQTITPKKRRKEVQENSGEILNMPKKNAPKLKPKGGAITPTKKSPEVQPQEGIVTPKRKSKGVVTPKQTDAGKAIQQGTEIRSRSGRKIKPKKLD